MVFTYLVTLYSRAFRGYFWSVKSLSMFDSINMSIIDDNRVPKVTPPSVDIPIWRHVMTVGRVFIPHDQYCGHTRSLYRLTEVYDSCPRPRYSSLHQTRWNLTSRSPDLVPPRIELLEIEVIQGGTTEDYALPYWSPSVPNMESPQVHNVIKDVVIPNAPVASFFLSARKVFDTRNRKPWSNVDGLQ